MDANDSPTTSDATAQLLHQARANEAARALGNDLPYPDAPTGTSDLIEAVKYGNMPGQDAAFTPAAGRICAYCQGSLDDGQSHLHGGQSNYPSVADPDLAWHEANQAYATAMEAAFTAYRDQLDAAWGVYQAARQQAEAALADAQAAAGAAWDHALVDLNAAGRRG